MFASLVTAGALFAVPATGQAMQPAGHGNANKSAKGCDKKTVKVGYSVGGTFVSATPDDLSTPANETAITLKITSAQPRPEVRRSRGSGPCKEGRPGQGRPVHGCCP